MKRSLFFVSVLLAGMAVSAQEYGLVDYMSIDGGSGVSTKLQSGTVVATDGYGLEVKAACEDDYKSVAVNTDGYEAYMFNGTYLNGMTGITGNANPKAADGTPLTNFANYNNAVPVDGTAYTFTVSGNNSSKLVGYFYACGRLVTDKQYWVTEGRNAIGYEIDMVVNGKAEHFEVVGEPDNYGRLTSEAIYAQFRNIQAASGWTATPSLDEMRGYDRGNWQGTGASVVGMGYIKFPVYEGMTYYFGGSGSKYQFSAFYLSSGDEEVEVYLRDNDGELDDLLLTLEEEPEEPVSVNVPDYGGVGQALSLVDAIGVVLPAGTVVALGEKEGYEVKVACDDTYRATGVDTDGYDAYVFNGTQLDIVAGITGNANPLTADGRNMGYIEDYGNAVPASGCAYAFTAPGNDRNALVGYFYACGRFSLNKAYWVTEDTYAIGYEIDMVNGGNVERFAVKGDPYNYLSQGIIKAQFTNLPPSVQAAGGWTSTPSLDEMRGYDRNTWPGPNTGMGYIKFPVYEGLNYYFGACGAKFPFSAFYLSSGNERVTVLLRDSAGDLADLHLSGEEPTSITPHDAVEVVQEEYYTVSGIRVPALVPGLNLVRQILSDGSVRTVKAVR